MQSPSGAKGKERDLALRMQAFWSQTFSNVFPDTIDMVGRSILKAIVADQMGVCILANATTHFASHCRKYCIHLGVEKRDSSRVVADTF